MRFLMKDGTAIEVKAVVGIVPARVRFVLANGAEAEVRECDIVQIDPPFKQAPKELQA
jgi:hypothetical protein